MTASRIPPLVDLFPDTKGPRLSPFEPGGVGKLFIHVSNRNQCSYLFDALPVGFEGMKQLDRAFPIGYATLYVLKKVCVVGKVHESRIPASLKEAEAYSLLVDPRVSAIGSSALVSEEYSYEKAREVARDLSNRAECSVVVATLIESMSWH